MNALPAAAPASSSTPDRPPAARGEDDWGPFSGLPGHPLMWVLIGSELLVFGAALMGFLGARIADPAGFRLAQDHLDRFAGGINTLVLLTSGLFVAIAVVRAKQGQAGSTRLWLGASAALGVVFLAVKAIEYTAEIGAGWGLDGGGFITLYFLITGFHALHVVMGIAILAIVARWPTASNVETGAAFWHMVDLVWLLVFPIVYLVR